MTITPRNHAPAPPGASADDWRHRALCKGQWQAFDTDKIDYNDAADPNLRLARAFCDGCPVKVACLLSAMREEQGEAEHGRWGIRGTFTPRERRKAYLFPAAVQRWIEYPGRPRHQLWAGEALIRRGAA